MGLKLDGTGYLEYPGKIVSGFPCSILEWVSRDASTDGTDQYWLTQTQTNANSSMGMFLDPNGSSKYANIANAGGSQNATETTTPTSTMRLAVAVYTSTTSKTMYYNSSTGVTNTAPSVDDLTNHDRCVVGARHYNGTSAMNFMNGKVAETHFFNVALTPTQIAALLADTVKPEDTTGWVDGWTFKNFNAGGTYTSIGGSRTMTAVGGVTDAGVHPITRTAPSQTLTGANCAQVNTSSTGVITQTTPPPGINLTGLNCSQVNTSSTGAITQTGAATGTITHRALTRNSHSGTSPQPWSNETGLTIRYYSMTTGAPITSKTGWTTNASGVPPAVTDALLVPGTSYEVLYILAGGARGRDILAAV